MKMHNNQYKLVNNHGNVLFIVLIAVALLAALSYAVTSSNSGGNIDRERSEIQAAEIIQFTNIIARTVDRIHMINRCDYTEISFENPTVSGYVNPNAPADKSCHIFDPNGGELTWKKPPIGVNDNSDYEFTSRAHIPKLGKSCSSSGETDCSELTLLLFNLTLDACNGLNLGFSYNFSLPPENNGTITSEKFTGSYSMNDTISAGGVLDGKITGCFREQGGARRYIFYYVLAVR